MKRAQELLKAAHKEQLPQRTKVEIIESERGWGQKLDETLYFDKREDAEEYVKIYNAQNTSVVVPEWYMYARIV